MLLVIHADIRTPVCAPTFVFSAGRWEQALAVVEDAVDDGLELTSPVFCAMITAFGRGGEWRQALTVLYEDMPRYQVLPDKFCYNMALR